MRARVHGEVSISTPIHPLGAESNAVTVGYMFRTLLDDPENLLPVGPATVDALTALGNAMSVDPSPEESTIPAAYTYFGQFIDHDITKTQFDPSLVGPGGEDPINHASLEPIANAEVVSLVQNARSLTFDLDSLYGGLALEAMNPDGSLQLSEVSPSPFGAIATADRLHDLKRRPLIPNPQTETEKEADRQALIGDPRNDENLIVAQLHVAFIRAHNALIQRGLSAEAAQSAMRRRYQWAVLHDFLPRISDPETFSDIITNHPRVWQPDSQDDLFMPLEFSAAAYRFGHSMIRGEYFHNSTFNPGDFRFFFTFTALSGDLAPGNGPSVASATLPDNWIIDWSRFFGSQVRPESLNPARRIDTNLTPELGKLRDFQGMPFNSLMAHLATRNLRRGYLLSLPTGQAVARLINAPVLEGAALLANVPTQFGAIIANAGLDTKTPLWFYILAEAAGPLGSVGNHLGPVGSRIVGETFWNAIRFSKDSVIVSPPTPEELATGEFTLKGIVRMGLDSALPPLVD